MERQTLKDEALLAILPNVAFDGWSDKAVRYGLESLGLDQATAARLFPGGAIDLIGHFLDWVDREMVATLEAEGESFTGRRTADRITRAVQVRLEILEPHKDAVRRAVALLGLPHNGGRSLRLMHRTVDAIWAAAGDASTDFSYYTKRGLLAAVLGATLLYWLNDESDDHERTLAFLDRRIGGVVRAGKAVGAVGRFSALAEGPLRMASGLRRHLPRRPSRDAA